MSNSTLPPIVPDINISKGVDGIFVGFVFSTILLGVTILQAWTYARNNNDTWKLRSFVVLLVALDIGSTVSNSVFIHAYLIEHFGNFVMLTTVNNGFLAEFAITVFVVFLVQLFLASRVHLLNPRNYWIAGIIALTAVLAFGSSLYTIAQQVKHRNVSDLYIPEIRISCGFDQAMIIVADSIATLVLSINFLTAKSKSHVKSTIGILQNLLAFTVARGLLVTISDLAFMILFFVNPTNLDWMPIHLSLSKLYVITMIALLNARPGRSYNSHMQSKDMNSFHLTTSSGTAHGSRFPVKSNDHVGGNSNNLKIESKNIMITQQRDTFDDTNTFSAV